MVAPPRSRIYPPAQWRPVAYRGLHGRILRKAALLHTNAGGAQLKGWWDQIAAAGGHIGAHYQVFWDGRVECYVDPFLVVYHAYSASEWAIGIETEDDGTNTIPWTQAQMHSMAGILSFHDVPAKMLTKPTGADGIGYHRQFDAWNGSNHNCPGSVREAQIPQILAIMNGAARKPEPFPIPPPQPGDDVITIMCSPGKHNPRMLPGDKGATIGAVMGQADWTAYNELAAVGGAKIVVMKTQSSYDQIVSDLGGTPPA